MSGLARQRRLQPCLRCASAPYPSSPLSGLNEGTGRDIVLLKPFTPRCFTNMAKLDGGTEAVRPIPPTGDSYVEDLFRARYLEMIRLAGLLCADDPGPGPDQASAGPTFRGHRCLMEHGRPARRARRRELRGGDRR